MHYTKLERMTEEHHLEIYAKMKELMWTDSMVLLTKYCHLLENDIGQLGYFPSAYQSYWIASVELALSAAKHVYTSKQSWYHFETFKVPKKRSL